MLAGLLIATLVLATSSLAIRLSMDRDAELMLRPGEGVPIAALRDPLPGNSFLACPAGYCRASAAPSPKFAMSVGRLAAAMERVIATEPHVFVIESAPQTRRIVLIQRTPLLRFPDIVTIEYVALGSDRSSVAIHSRSRYGRSDFGTNRRRVLAWLDRLKADAAAPQ